MFTIGPFAKTCGVGVETVRFYQRQGLIEQPVKSEGGRKYGESHIRRLMFIRNAQSAGFTLREIKTLLNLDAVGDKQTVKNMAKDKIQLLDQKIAWLQQARKALSLLTDECSASNSGPCPILEAFEF